MSNRAGVIEIKERGRGRPPVSVDSHYAVPEQAAAFGISLPEMKVSNERFISPIDVGKILNVTGEAVKQWIYRRRLPAVKLANGYWKIKVADFEGFFKARIAVGKHQVLITDNINSGSSEVIDAVKNLGNQSVLAHNYADALLKALDQLPTLFINCVDPDDPGCWKFTEKIRSHKSLRRVPILFIAGIKISDSDTESAVK